MGSIFKMAFSSVGGVCTTGLGRYAALRGMRRLSNPAVGANELGANAPRVINHAVDTPRRVESSHLRVFQAIWESRRVSLYFEVFVSRPLMRESRRREDIIS